MTIHKLSPQPEECAKTFGGYEAVLRVKSGDIIEIQAPDCFGNQLTSPEQIASEVVNPEMVDAVAGPIYIEGAEVGDILAVHFISLTPLGKYAVSASYPGFGALNVTDETALLTTPLPERNWFYELDLEHWTAKYRARNSDFEVVLPLEPMQGTIGVAPAGGEARAVVVPHKHGGNMDSPELRVGTTAYFPVSVAGALLGLGDGHARQGEGEIIGAGLECAMKTVIAVEVIKNQSIDWPRFENDDFIMTTVSVRGLDDAFRVSQKEMVNWVSELTSLDTLDALQLVSQIDLAPVANMVDPNFTMVSKVPKKFLNGKADVVYGGIHTQLKKIGETYKNSNY